jgi:hypothetical protein
MDACRADRGGGERLYVFQLLKNHVKENSKVVLFPIVSSDMMSLIAQCIRGVVIP